MKSLIRIRKPDNTSIESAFEGNAIEGLIHFALAKLMLLSTTIGGGVKHAIAPVRELADKTKLLPHKPPAQPNVSWLGNDDDEDEDDGDNDGRWVRIQ